MTAESERGEAAFLRMWNPSLRATVAVGKHRVFLLTAAPRRPHSPRYRRPQMPSKVQGERGGFVVTRGKPRYAMLEGRHFVVGHGRSVERPTLESAYALRDEWLREDEARRTAARAAARRSRPDHAVAGGPRTHRRRRGRRRGGWGAVGARQDARAERRAGEPVPARAGRLRGSCSRSTCGRAVVGGVEPRNAGFRTHGSLQPGLPDQASRDEARREIAGRQ